MRAQSLSLTVSVPADKRGATLAAWDVLDEAARRLACMHRADVHLSLLMIDDDDETSDS